VKVLRQLYRTRSNAAIAEQLGRKISAVRFKAYCLNPSKGQRRLREMGQENIGKRWGAR
jgi:hypothetical protein